MGRHGDENRRRGERLRWSCRRVAVSLCHGPGRSGRGEASLSRAGHLGSSLVICYALDAEKRLVYPWAQGLQVDNLMALRYRIC